MLSRLRSFLTVWARRERFEDGLDAEVRFHLDADTEDLVRSGVPRREAVRRARIHFGGVASMKEDCRRARGLRLVDELAQTATNLRLALRTLLKSPMVTGVAVVSLALGIGSNAAIFSLYSEILLRPLPVDEPERLVNLEAPGPKPGTVSYNAAGGCDEVFSYPMFRDLEREQTVFTDLAAHRALQVTGTWRSRSIHGTATLVSGSYFPALGLAPAAGRLFGREVDERVGGHPSVVLSHAFWQSDLGGSPDARLPVLAVCRAHPAAGRHRPVRGACLRGRPQDARDRAPARAGRAQEQRRVPGGTGGRGSPDCGCGLRRVAGVRRLNIAERDRLSRLDPVGPDTSVRYPLQTLAGADDAVLARTRVDHDRGGDGGRPRQLRAHANWRTVKE